MKAAATRKIKTAAEKTDRPDFRLNTMAFNRPPLRFALPKKSLALATLTINILALAVPVMTLQVYDRMLVSHNVATLQVLVAGVIVAVMGEGFNWKKYLDIDPSRATDNHGRGIAQARAISFDEITFNTKGNKVTAIVRNEEEIEW